MRRIVLILGHVLTFCFCFITAAEIGKLFFLMRRNNFGVKVTSRNKSNSLDNDIELF